MYIILSIAYLGLSLHPHFTQNGQARSTNPIQDLVNILRISVQASLYSATKFHHETSTDMQTGRTERAEWRSTSTEQVLHHKAHEEVHWVRARMVGTWPDNNPLSSDLTRDPTLSVGISIKNIIRGIKFSSLDAVAGICRTL